jgi:uncharacterized membrane protein
MRTGLTKAYLIAIRVLSVVLSWATVHTIFTLRYARTFYQLPEGASTSTRTIPRLPGLRLPWLHHRHDLSGVGHQSHDEAVRRIARTHGLLSFLFGAVILALSINVVASLL